MNKEQTKQKILETKRLTESVDYHKGYDRGSKHSETYYKQELKSQTERADDHFACILADLYLRIKKIQSLADKKDAIYIALQELLEEIKK